MMARQATPRSFVLAGLAGVIALAAASTVAIAAWGGAFGNAPRAPDGACSAPPLAGSVVDVELTNMGRAMMGNGMGGMMRVLVNRHNVTSGTVSFRVVNTGSLVHELLVLPLDAGQRVGQRNVGADARVDESASVGEASNSCGEGGGDGINPGSISWVTLQLAPGNYELLCNLPGHYAAGMYTQLRVQ